MESGSGDKLERLQTLLAPLKSALLAYSGGVDSSLLLRVAHGVMGERLLAVTVDSELFHDREIRDARDYAEALGARHRVMRIEMLNEAPFLQNPRDRCYGCKTIIFTRLLRLAEEQGFASLLEGSNSDDTHAFRPGLKALAEMAVRSPLKEAGLSKGEIRAMARDLGIPSWDSPSRPCLATRFPYGDAITPDSLERVKQAEVFLSGLGFREFRVRVHGGLARIEAGRSETAALDDGTAEKIVRKFKSLGFLYVSLDLEGFRSGSMDEGTVTP